MPWHKIWTQFVPVITKKIKNHTWSQQHNYTTSCNHFISNMKIHNLNMTFHILEKFISFKMLEQQRWPKLYMSNIKNTLQLQYSKHHQFFSTARLKTGWRMTVLRLPLFTKSFSVTATTAVSGIWVLIWEAWFVAIWWYVCPTAAIIIWLRYTSIINISTLCR